MEDCSNYLSIGAFAQLSGIKRKTLIYYDQINLLKPKKVGENGYRYYHYHQLYKVNMLHFFKEIGMSLEEIKDYNAMKTPEQIIALIQNQKENIKEKQRYYNRIEKMLDLQLQSLNEVKKFDSRKISIEKYEAVPLYYSKAVYNEVTPRFSLSLNDFYQQCIAEGYEFSYPTGMAAWIKKDGTEHADVRYYLKVPESDVFRPEGTYLEYFSKGNFDYDRAYNNLQKAAFERGMTLKGKLYVDFIQNELVAQNFDEFILKVMMQVEEKEVTESE